MSIEAGTRDGFVLKGWHVLLMFVGFFGVIVTVNFYMAAMASKSWTGLYSKNGYVASQEFDVRTEQMARLGWRATVSVAPEAGGMLIASIVGADGAPVRAETVVAVVG